MRANKPDRLFILVGQTFSLSGQAESLTHCLSNVDPPLFLLAFDDFKPILKICFGNRNVQWIMMIGR
jgi:hypothetical protein